MSQFTKGQKVICTNPRKQEKLGKYLRQDGAFLVCEVDGVEKKYRPACVVAA